MIPTSILLGLVFTIIYFAYDFVKMQYNFENYKVIKLYIDCTFDFTLSFLWINAIFNYTWYGVVISFLTSILFGIIKNMPEILQKFQLKK